MQVSYAAQSEPVSATRALTLRAYVDDVQSYESWCLYEITTIYRGCCGSEPITKTHFNG